MFQIEGAPDSVATQASTSIYDISVIGQQKPGNSAQIQSFCETSFGVSFLLFQKIEVNGSNAHPLYQYLTKAAPGIFGTEGIKWNFTKFLVDRSGRVVKRYPPTTKPEDLAKDIQALL